MEAFIYTRISLDRADEAGVKRQERECRKLAEQLGWNVAKVYVENDTSARVAKSRPVFQQMLKALGEGHAKGLIFWHPDRAYRTLIDLDELVQVAKANTIQIRTVKAGQVDLSTASGIMQAEILASVAKHESARIGERSRAAKDERALAGKPAGGGFRRFGFETDGITHRPDEAAMVRLAAGNVLNGQSLRSLAAAWDEAGLKTVRGGKWNPSSIRQFLTAPHIAGIQVLRGEQIGKGAWEPILDEDTWRAVCALLTDPARKSAYSRVLEYQGSGLYLCGICGGVLRPTMTRQKKWYRCAARDHLSVRLETFDEIVSGIIIAYLIENDPATVLSESEPDIDVEALRSRRESLSGQLAERVDMLDAGELTREQFSRSSGRIKDELASIERELAMAVVVSPFVGIFEEKDVEQSWHSAPVEVRRQIIDHLAVVTLLKGDKHAPKVASSTLGRVKIEWK